VCPVDGHEGGSVTRVLLAHSSPLTFGVRELTEPYEIVHVPEPLATMEMQVAQQDTAGLYTAAAIRLTVDMNTGQRLITPGKLDLPDGVEMRQRGIAAHQDTTPDEWADTAQGDAQLVDVEWRGRGSHVLRVAQCRISLKDSPRYLALSLLRAA
jgi:hypothetical protein